MNRGGTGLRRRLASIALTCSLGIAVVPTGATANTASGEALRQAGEAGSGPAPFPIELPARMSNQAASFRWSDLEGFGRLGQASDRLRGQGQRLDAGLRRAARRVRALQVPTCSSPASTSRGRWSKPSARGAEADPAITFTDLDPSQGFYRCATIAVQRGWMDPAADGRFVPDGAVTIASLHATLVGVLGLRRIARRSTHCTRETACASRRRDASEHRCSGCDWALATTRRATSRSTWARADAADARPGRALALPRRTLPSWVVPWSADQYVGIVLPNMGPRPPAIVGWGVDYVGYPYVWGGEWGSTATAARASASTCSGFDLGSACGLRQNDGGAWMVASARVRTQGGTCPTHLRRHGDAPSAPKLRRRCARAT